MKNNPMNNNKQKNNINQNSLKKVSLRKFPYPYKAALSISNDIDYTTFEDFVEIHNFLNTKQQTPMGPGLGLEIGDTFWMYSVHPEESGCSYFKGTTTELSEYAEIIRKFILAGYIDCLHTYGHFCQYGGFTRKMGEQAIFELEKWNLRVDVWINHGDLHNLQNIGNTLCQGDLRYTRGSDGMRTRVSEYHSDITTAYGIRFVWKSDLTSVIGQDVSFRFLKKMVLRCKHLISKFLLKRPLAVDYTNDLVEEMELRDGSKVYTFKRFGFWDKASADDLSEIISKDNLYTLKRRNGYMIVYTHLGHRKSEKTSLFSIETQKALRILSEEYYGGEIYITTTSKLLNYNIVHKFLRWHCSFQNGGINIVIEKVADKVRGDYLPTPKQLQGITFYTPCAEKTRIFIMSNEIADIQRNPRDYTGKESVSIPLTHLQYPLSE